MFDSVVLPKDSLVRCADEKPKTVLIVGSGAIEGGWEPLPEALGCPRITNPHVIGSVLASYTYHYRRLRNELLIAMHDEGADPIKKFESLRSELHKLREHRQQIAAAYQTAYLSDALSMRECVPVDEIIKASGSLGVITTNWDPVIWMNRGFKNVVQLHGLCSNPDSLILPSELGIDDHIFELAIKQAMQRDSEKHKESLAKIAGHFRGAQAELLKNAHSVAVEWIRSAEEIVVWGLALHPYDAELLTVLQSNQGPGKTKTLKRATFVDPCGSARDRAGFFLGAPPIERRDYDPELNKWV